jgi:GYF domain 2
MKSNPAAPLEAPTAFSTTIEGTWFVQTRAGILSLTLDELDRAYQRGELTASTSVFTSGMDAWDTLGNVANLEGEGSDASGPSSEDAPEIEVELIDMGSFPPTSTLPRTSAGVFGSNELSGAIGTPAEAEGHTVVRRSTGVVPYPIRKAAGRVADFSASLRLTHPRLAAAGPWLFGAALSSILVFSLYALGAATPRPGADTTSGGITARTTAGEAPVASASRPSSAAPASAAAPLPIETSTPRAAPPERDPSPVTTLRPIDLRLAATSRAEARHARSARAKARAARASATSKAKPRSAHKAKRREKSGSRAFN